MIKKLDTAYKHLLKTYEEYLRVLGSNNKTVQALKKVLEALKIAYPDL